MKNKIHTFMHRTSDGTVLSLKVDLRKKLPKITTTVNAAELKPAALAEYEKWSESVAKHVETLLSTAQLVAVTMKGIQKIIGKADR